MRLLEHPSMQSIQDVDRKWHFVFAYLFWLGSNVIKYAYRAILTYYYCICKCEIVFRRDNIFIHLIRSLMKEVFIPKNDAGKALFTYLKRQFPLGFVRKLFRKNGLKINGKKEKQEYILKESDKLVFYIKFDEDLSRKSLKNRGFELLYENENFAIINKVPGFSVQQWTDIKYEDSLEYKLKEYFKKKNENVFLVHRLDKDTSGALLLVKKEALVPEFEKMFKESKIKKIYTTLVKGVIKKKKGTVKIPIPGRQGFLVNALTFYEVVKVFEQKYSLVKIKLKTGRKHQIRLHMSKIGHPVVMDKKYGDFNFNKTFRQKYKLERQFLHASSLSFEWNATPYDFEVPLSKDLLKVLEMLKTL